MIIHEDLVSICKKYGTDYFLRQLAEECTELTQAALKIIRAQKGETPIAMETAQDEFLEEIGDVLFMIWCVQESILTVDDYKKVDRIIDSKAERMKRRML